MQFTETKLKDAFIIDLELKQDYRGFFARTFCQKEFEAHGLKPIVAQCNLSFNYKKGHSTRNALSNISSYGNKINSLY